MSDVADLTSSMVIRPGLVPVWRFVGSDSQPAVNESAKQEAIRPSRFGARITFSVHPESCCGAIFVCEVDGSVEKRLLGDLEFFFRRDGIEALVFEFDRYQNRFYARGWNSLLNRSSV